MVCGASKGRPQALLPESVLETQHFCVSLLACSTCCLMSKVSTAKPDYQHFDVGFRPLATSFMRSSPVGGFEEDCVQSEPLHNLLIRPLEIVAPIVVASGAGKHFNNSFNSFT